MEMTEKLRWMHGWAEAHGLELHLNGEIGFARPAVTVTNADGTCPDYGDPMEGDRQGVWAPERAYHKYQCVAVLGHDEEAQLQMFEWMRWFDANGYTVEHGLKPRPDSIGALLGDQGCRMGAPK